MTISFSGVGSGTDWGSIISQLVAAEKAPATALTQKKSDANAQLSLVADLVTRMGKLAGAGDGLATSASLWSYKATASSGIVAATASGTTTPGTYAVHVGKLAVAEARASKEFTSSAGPGDGAVSIGVGGGAAVQVSFKTTDTLADIAAAINAQVPGVTASAIYDGTSYRLVVGSNTAGSSGALTVSETGAGLGLAVTQPAADASLSVNGLPVTRSSNHVTDLIPGVTLDLAATGDTTVTVTRDPSSIAGKVHALVDAYNSVAQLLGQQSTYDGTRKGADTLFGDPIVSQLQTQLGAVITSAVAHGAGTTSLAALGITLGSDGQLSVDDSKLTGALSADPTIAQDLFTGSSGVGGAMAILSRQYTSTTGALLTREDSLRKLMARYDDEVQQINDRADAYQTQLQDQFASLDKLMAAYTTDTSYLSALSTSTKG